MTRYVATLGDRSLFPDLKPRVYAHHAAIAPPSLAVTSAVSAALQSYAERGAGAFMGCEAQRTALRENLARLIGGQAPQIALISNTSQGISDIALCVPWRPHDRVLLFSGEFPANITPWQAAAKLFELELVWHEANDFRSATGRGLERLESELRRGLRMVAISAVEFQSGLATPLAEIGALCKKYDAELCVDAIQACGVVPLDVVALNIDYLVSGGHKWLMGMEGAGFSYVKPDRARVLRPHVAGWLSHEEPTRFLFEGAGLLSYERPLKDTAQLFEKGTPNVLGCAALAASVELLMVLGIEAIFGHVSAYLTELERRLIAHGFTSQRGELPASYSGILSCAVPSGTSIQALHRELGARGVVCGMPDGLLRFAPHWPNALAEVEYIDGALAECLALPSVRALKC